MSKIVTSIFVVLLTVVSLDAEGIEDKYDRYIEKLQKERDRMSDDRELKAEMRRWNDDIDKLTNRREYADKLRETRASVRKEFRRVF